MKYLTLAAGLCAATAASAETPVLNVYTYDSFTSDWGPGPAIEAAFEDICNCDLQFSAVGDGAALIARLNLEGDHSEADVVLGIDTNLADQALADQFFVPHTLENPTLTLPIEWDNATYVPYDWGYFAFIYDNTKTDSVPANFRDLAASDLKIVIQDPRSSTPGLGLMMWVKAAYGDEAPAIWADLSDNIVTVTKGWSESYGMFLEGEADMALSYTTSPAYHLIAEDDASKSAVAFDEGHYMQIEVAAVTKSADQPELAQQFLEFMISDAAQTILPTTNWMYPAATPTAGLPEGFETLTVPEKSLLIPAEDAGSVREAALTEWLDALSQ
ncbi:thiamine ABC transporter substrate binding subunit [Halocynthiibacter styelae]|uniref:Thiamine ABC transporter substrate binding subunit n=1 Tax=Halocynthiibacter styelae TaxID=2761955 RepID=A0A8J7IDV6_9RHOB|nr:thiamine ABC transporter substrate binding subunit [Paenihalocynthiibacter styelae]MBI1494803.1 thiamine ABC transporter substrate binding subunit [Paenihalocynthiibacter styelae]